MITFTCSLIALVVGFFVYGKFVERVFGIKPDRQTPAYSLRDGVDYIPMPTWKVYMIQFLNIAGTGPIFGAIMIGSVIIGKVSPRESENRGYIKGKKMKT